MPNETQLREMVRRVVGRAMAERGRTAFPAGRPESAHVSGVHVDVRPGGAVDRPTPEADDPQDDARLVTARCIAAVESGGSLRVPPGAIVTDLARDEAWKRGIRLVEGDLRSTPGSGASSRLRIALGADHGGFAMKQALSEWVRELGHLALDLGTNDERPVDYPDFARAVAEAVAQGRVDLGICVDGAGIGSAMAANKVPGVRAAMCYDAATARNAREHNHANVLTLGGRMLGMKTANEVVRAFLSTPVGGERHAKRVEKITAIERSYSGGSASARSESHAATKGAR